MHCPYLSPLLSDDHAKFLNEARCFPLSGLLPLISLPPRFHREINSGPLLPSVRSPILFHTLASRAEINLNSDCCAPIPTHPGIRHGRYLRCRPAQNQTKYKCPKRIPRPGRCELGPSPIRPHSLTFCDIALAVKIPTTTTYIITKSKVVMLIMGKIERRV